MVIGPLLCNLFYDYLLRLELPAGVQIVGFTDDIAVMGTAHTTKILEEVINSVLVKIADRVSDNGPRISVHKIQAII